MRLRPQSQTEYLFRFLKRAPQRPRSRIYGYFNFNTPVR